MIARPPIVALVLALSAAGCRNEPVQHERREAVAHHPSAPLVATWEGPKEAQPGEIVTLVARVRREGPTAPVVLRVELPAGATLDAGAGDETIGGDDREIVRSFRVRLGAVAGSVTMTATSQGEGWGARAEHRWSPGGETASPPPPRGTDVTLPGGRSLGAPVDATR